MGSEMCIRDRPKDHVDEREQWLASLYPLLVSLEARGLTWQWINPEKTEQLQTVDGQVALNDQRFHGVLLHEVGAMPAATAENLAKLSEQGARVIVSGTLPQRQTGLVEAQTGDAIVKTAMQRVRASALLPDNLEPGPVRFLANGIQQARRKLASGERLIYLNNTKKTAQTLKLDYTGNHESLSVLDSWNGVSWPLVKSAVEDHNYTVTLPPYGSLTLLASDKLLPDTRNNADRFYDRSTRITIQTLDNWLLQSENQEWHLDTLADWQSIPALADSSSPARYLTTVKLEPAAGERYRLRFTDVYGVAEVTVNDRDVGKLVAYPFALDITEALIPGENKLAIRYRPNRRNAKSKILEEQGGIKMGSTARTAAGIVGEATIEVWR